MIGELKDYMPLNELRHFNIEKENVVLADRFNAGKIQWSLVDFKSLEPMVRVLEYGAKKYSRDQWKLGLPTLEVCESLLRHTFAFMNGENDDSESGLPHIGHIQCNAMFLAYILREKKELDTRRKDVPSSK